MANKFWRGAAGLTKGWYDTSPSTYWADSDTGAIGASAPASTDVVYCTANSLGGLNVNHPVSGITSCAGLICTGFAHNISGSELRVKGSVTLASGMAVHINPYLSITGTANLDCAGCRPEHILIRGNITAVADVLAGELLISSPEASSFNANGYNVTVGTFTSSSTQYRTVTMGSGIWTLTGTGTVWDCATSTHLTLTPGTSSIVINNNSATAKTFAGGGKTYNSLEFTGGVGSSGSLTISGNNTFAHFAVTTASLSKSLVITAGTTQTFTGDVHLVGASGKTITFNSSSTSAYTFSKSSGTVDAYYCDIHYSTASGGAEWNASTENGNTDGGNNSGWVFTWDEHLVVADMAFSFTLDPVPAAGMGVTAMAFGFAVDGDVVIVENDVEEDFMASEIAICNLALVHLGEERILTIGDSVKAARTLKAIYALTRDALLRAHRWRFAMKRASLTVLSTTPTWGPAYQYQIPSDCLRIDMVGEYYYSVPGEANYIDSETVPYQIEGNKILTDIESPLSIRYISREDDAGMYDACFSAALALRLAIVSCQDISGSLSKEDGLLRQYKQAISEAITTQAIEQYPESIASGTWENVRL